MDLATLHAVASLFALPFGVMVMLLTLYPLIVRPLQDKTVGPFRFGFVFMLALPLFYIDVVYLHAATPLSFLPEWQDACSFDGVSKEDYQAIAREKRTELGSFWDAHLGLHRRKMKDPNSLSHLGRTLATRIQAVLPENELPEGELLAHIHAVARALGAELDIAVRHTPLPSPRNGFEVMGKVAYRFDYKSVFYLRPVYWRWARIGFSIGWPDADGRRARLHNVSVLTPGLKDKGYSFEPPKVRSCPVLRAIPAILRPDAGSIGRGAR